MKTQHNTLNFKKDSVLELNDEHLLQVEGGTSHTVTIPIIAVYLMWVLR